VWIDQAVNNENDFAAADNFVGDYCYCYYYLTPARSSQGMEIIIIYNVLIWETLSRIRCRVTLQSKRYQKRWLVRRLS